MTEITGLDQLKANFAQVKDDMIKRTARTAVAAGARVIRNAAKTNALAHGFRKSGLLIRSIKSFQRRSGVDPGTTVFSIGIPGRGKKNHPFYWRFLEFGWNHTGTAYRKQAKTITPIPARPFLAPALQQNQEAAVRAMADSVAKSLEKYGRKE